jgi:hypothetical protein
MHASASPPGFVVRGDRKLQECLFSVDGIGSRKAYDSLSDLEYPASQKRQKTRCINAQSRFTITPPLWQLMRENLVSEFGDGWMHLFNYWGKILCDQVINACICNPSQICSTWRSNVAEVLARDGWHQLPKDLQLSE